MDNVWELDLFKEDTDMMSMFELSSDFNTYDDPINYFYWCEDVEVPFESFLEDATSEPVQKKNIFARIWELLKRLGRWIRGKFAAVGRWLKGEQTTGSPEEAAEAANIKPSGNDDDVPLNIPAGDASTLVKDGEKINSIVKPFSIQKNKNGMVTVIISPKKPMSTKSGKNNPAEYDDNDANQNNWANQRGAVNLILAYINEMALQSGLPASLSKVVTALANRKEVPADDLKTLGDKFKMKLVPTKEGTVSKIQFPVDNFTKAEEAFDNINKVLESFDASVADEYTQRNVNAVNLVAKVVRDIQLGLNALAIYMKNSYIVDAKYKNSIDNLQALDLFVSKLIEMHVPAKYIAYNIWITASEKIRGNEEKYKPTWWLSTAILTPTGEDDGFEYRIALSSTGIRCNKLEHSIYVKAKEAGKASIFAPSRFLSKNGIVEAVAKTDDLSTVGDTPKLKADKAALEKQVYELGNSKVVPYDLTKIMSYGPSAESSARAQDAYQLLGYFGGRLVLKYYCPIRRQA